MSVVKLINFFDVMFLSKASFSIVYLIKLGSFFLPLMGIGAKNGLSVSISNFSNGIVLNYKVHLKLSL